MKIAIIGAGPSGLCAAKEIAQQNPTATITLFEKAAQLGGGFTTSYDELALVNNPMLINFSDFLADGSLPALRMWSAQEYVAYLHRYAAHFQLTPHIEYNCDVLEAKPDGAGWQLTVACGTTLISRAFDYLVVCAGSNHHANIPELPQSGYHGTVLHARDVKNTDDFSGKQVVIIGLGETGSDLTQLAARTAKSVNVSIRRWPGYFIPRYHDNRPTDLDTSLIYHQLPVQLDNSTLGWLLRLKRSVEKNNIKTPLDRRIQEAADALNNQHSDTRRLGPFRRISTKSCGFLRALIENKVTLRSAITKLEGTTAYFDGGDSCEADIIICCTGYRLSFPYLPAELLTHVQSSNNLYNYIFPVDAHHKLAFIGYIRPAVGSVPPLAELQSRMLGKYLSGQFVLPTSDTMREHIKKQKTLAHTQFPFDSARVTHLVDYFTYMKKLATQLGVMPKQWAMLRDDPKLWLKVNCAFICPAMFRLYGAGSNYSLASKTIKRLPTMPVSVIALELVATAACRVLSAVGFSKYQIK